MKYVSAEWITPTTHGALKAKPVIRVIGDNGMDYWPLGVDSDDPAWVAFLKTAEGKAFLQTQPK